MPLLATQSSSSKLLKCLFILVVALSHLILIQMKRRVLQPCWVNRSALWERIIPVLGKALVLASGVWPSLGGEGDLGDKSD